MLKPKPVTTVPRPPEFIIVGYTHEGEVYGYFTERRTISDRRSAAARWGLEEVAVGTADYLNSAPGFKANIWVAEPAD